MKISANKAPKKAKKVLLVIHDPLSDLSGVSIIKPAVK